MFKVEKNIPIQDTNRKPTGYPFKTMEVGDSFLVSKDLDSKVRCAATYYSRRAKTTKGKRFLVRRTPEGVRTWRVE
jgi:hypothetical protein